MRPLKGPVTALKHCKHSDTLILFDSKKSSAFGDLYSNARHPLDESNSEYTDPSAEKTGKKKLSHGKNKDKKVLYSVAQVS